MRGQTTAPAAISPSSHPEILGVCPEIVMVGAIKPATAVAWQTTGRPQSGVGRRHAAPGPSLTPQCPSCAMRPQSQVLSHNHGARPDSRGRLVMSFRTYYNGM